MSLDERLKRRTAAQDLIHHITAADLGLSINLEDMYSRMGGDGTEPENVLRAFFQILWPIANNNPIISFWTDQLSKELKLLND